MSSPPGKFFLRTDGASLGATAGTMVSVGGIAGAITHVLLTIVGEHWEKANQVEFHSAVTMIVASVLMVIAEWLRRRLVDTRPTDAEIANGRKGDKGSL